MLILSPQYYATKVETNSFGIFNFFLDALLLLSEILKRRFNVTACLYRYITKEIVLTNIFFFFFFSLFI
jgi:hypothetical protein